MSVPKEYRGLLASGVPEDMIWRILKYSADPKRKLTPMQKAVLKMEAAKDNRGPWKDLKSRKPKKIEPAPTPIMKQPELGLGE